MERGAVLEEWRMGRDSAGRAQEAHWQLIMKGCRVRLRELCIYCKPPRQYARPA